MTRDRRLAGSVGRPFDVVGLGLNAVDRIFTVQRYPPRGGKERILATTTLPGGQVSSAMVGARRLGLRARYIGKVGDDEAGATMAQSLRAEGVDCEHLTVVQSARTQCGIIVLDGSSRERTVFWDHDPRTCLASAEVSRSAIGDARILHVDGFDHAAAVKAAQWAREDGLVVTSDFDTAYPDLPTLLPLVDFLIIAEQLCLALAGERTTEHALRALARRYDCCAVVTLGERGALACAGDEITASPAYVPPKLEDTTGAGDAFRAGFIYGLARGLSLERTLRTANAVAALSCTALGARAGLPTEPELTGWLETARPRTERTLKSPDHEGGAT